MVIALRTVDLLAQGLAAERDRVVPGDSLQPPAVPEHVLGPVNRDAAARSDRLQDATEEVERSERRLLRNEQRADPLEPGGQICRRVGAPGPIPSDASVVVLGGRVRILAADELKRFDMLQGYVVTRRQAIVSEEPV